MLGTMDLEVYNCKSTLLRERGNIMRATIVIVDYNKVRLDYLRARLQSRFKSCTVYDVLTDSPGGDVNTAKLEQLKVRNYNLLIGHIGGNPSGYECLRTFKESNPKGKAILYTKQDSIPIDKFRGLRLADGLFRRDQDDTKVFPNDDEILDLIADVFKKPAVTIWRNPFTDIKVLVALISLVGAVIGLVTALVKALGA
jgi:hypothetical protein